MKIKVKRNELEVGVGDLILDNGRVYILITQKVMSNYFWTHPSISKKLFKELLKAGKIRKSKKKYTSPNGVFDLYEFVGD